MGTAPYFAFGAVGITGQTESSLDAINSGTVNDNDIAVVLENEKIYFYRLNATSGKTHNPPYVVAPFNETGDKRWELTSQEVYNSNIIQLVGKYIQTSHIKAIDEKSIEIEASDGSKIIISTDGKVTFPSRVSGVTPVNDADFTTKQYVDNWYNTKESNLQSYADTELHNYVDTQIADKDTELRNYTDTELHDYVNSEVSAKSTELRNYTDTEVQNVYPIYTETISSWTASSESFFEGLYYADITHNKGYSRVIARFWEDGEIIYPAAIYYYDPDILRVYMPTDNSTINVTIM